MILVKIIPDTIKNITDQIKTGTEKIRELDAAKKKTLLDEDKLREDIDLQDRYTELCLMQNLSKTLIMKCDVSFFDSISDYQLLELNKNMGSLDIELREIFQKVSVLLYSTVWKPNRHVCDTFTVQNV